MSRASDAEELCTMERDRRIYALRDELRALRAWLEDYGPREICDRVDEVLRDTGGSLMGRYLT